tara:strand:- start:4123 stop:5508 length:1386 start_codon:yes stop_codon:yes gene_type:complete
MQDADSAGKYDELRRQHCRDQDRMFPILLEQTAWSKEQLRDHRELRLRELLRMVKESSPWHARRLVDLSPDSFKSEDISLLPIMTKADLMANYDEIAPDPRITLATVNRHINGLVGGAYLFDRYHAIASGGSSGLRGAFVYDWDAWIVLSTISARWGVRAATANPMPRLERPVSANVYADKASHISYAMFATFTRDTQNSYRFPISQPLSEIVAGLNRVQPDSLGAYPSALQMLIEEAQSGRLDIHPRSIGTCGEPLYAEISAAAEEVFGVKVDDVWGMSEGVYAGNCGQGEGMHLPDDLTWVEPVDAEGQPVPAGTRAAKLLLTNLYNHALPLIRYEVSDEITVLEDPCPCGSGHRRITSVLGRQDDLFRYGSATVHPQVFRSPLGREANVLEYRVTQTPSGAQIAICTRGAVDLKSLKKLICDGVRRAGLQEPQVDIRLVDSLQRQDSGKLKRFIPLPA